MKYARQFFLIAMICFFAVAPVVSFAQTGSTNSGSKPLTLDNPLKGGITSLSAFLEAILTNIVMPIAAIVVVILIIYTGFLFVTARGDVGQIKEAKQSLKNVIIGTVILFGSVAISYAIGNTLCQIAPSLTNCSTLNRLP